MVGLLEDVLAKVKTMESALTQAEGEYRTAAQNTEEKATNLGKQAKQSEAEAVKQEADAADLAALSAKYADVAK